MKQKSKPFDKSRRRFMSGAAAAGVGGVLAAVPAATTLAEMGEAEPNRKKARGYQLTQHVLDYYKSAAS